MPAGGSRQNPRASGAIVAPRTPRRHNVGMANKVIPLADHRYAAAAPRVPADLAAPNGRLADALGRPLRDLRISVTDRCNFRCSYCMPKEVFGRDYPFLPRAELLHFEEIARLARVFVAPRRAARSASPAASPCCARDVRRPGRALPARALDGCRSTSRLTTNGSLLARRRRRSRDAGLERVTVSLDSLDDARLPRA